MRGNLESRLSVLEKAAPEGKPPAIYIGSYETAAGWSWRAPEGQPFEVRRYPGETDDELRQRAYAAAIEGPPLDPRRAIVFFMITDPA